eukprot:767277-Hanusia_phi.AAC.2
MKSGAETRGPGPANGPAAESDRQPECSVIRPAGTHIPHIPSAIAAQCRCSNRVTVTVRSV